MKSFYRIIAIVSAIPLLIGIFFFENIKGYYRFKQYCEVEGGLRVHERLEKNVGWVAKDKYDARVAAQLKHVGFVRYEEDGKTYDLKFVGDNPQKDSSFDVSISDDSKQVVYKWHRVNEFISDELRLAKFGYEVIDSKNEKIFARYYSFSYSKFDRNRTLLDMPSGVSCFYSPAKHKNDISDWKAALDKSFKN